MTNEHSEIGQAPEKKVKFFFGVGNQANKVFNNANGNTS